jgi:hypothetical protein
LALERGVDFAPHGDRGCLSNAFPYSSLIDRGEKLDGNLDGNQRFVFFDFCLNVLELLGKTDEQASAF